MACRSGFHTRSIAGSGQDVWPPKESPVVMIRGYGGGGGATWERTRAFGATRLNAEANRSF